MSKNEFKAAYVLVKESNGKKYLCPVNPDRAPETRDPNEVDDCLEAEVVGRYAGNLN